MFSDQVLLQVRGAGLMPWLVAASVVPGEFLERPTDGWQKCWSFVTIAPDVPFSYLVSLQMVQTIGNNWIQVYSSNRLLYLTSLMCFSLSLQGGHLFPTLQGCGRGEAWQGITLQGSGPVFVNVHDAMNVHSTVENGSHYWGVMRSLLTYSESNIFWEDTSIGACITSLHWWKRNQVDFVFILISPWILKVAVLSTLVVVLGTPSRVWPKMQREKNLLFMCKRKEEFLYCRQHAECHATFVSMEKDIFLTPGREDFLCACVPLLHLCTLWLYSFLDCRNANYALWLHYLAVQNGSGVLRWVCPAAMYCGDLTLWSTKLCQKETFRCYP